MFVLKLAAHIMKSTVHTMKLRLENWSRLGGQEYLLGVLGQGSLLSRDDQLSEEPGPIPDVVILIVLG